MARETVVAMHITKSGVLLLRAVREATSGEHFPLQSGTSRRWMLRWPSTHRSVRLPLNSPLPRPRPPWKGESDRDDAATSGTCCPTYSVRRRLDRLMIAG